MNILHIASFLGNIGDNASHKGFYSILNNILANYSITKVEIRNFYKNYKDEGKGYFDAKFVDYINSFDICFVGGGGFLDYWVPESKTATTFDIDPKLLKRITTKLYFVSIGSNPHKEIPPDNIEKYRAFLDEAIKNPNIKFAFRNDGSIKSIEEDVGKEYAAYFSEILDHGFFYGTPKKQITPYPYVAINITSDQIMMKSKLRLAIDVDAYYHELVELVRFIIRFLEYKVVLVPHIYSDISAILTLMNSLSEKEKRNEVIVAPYVQGDSGAAENFGIYRGAEFVIGTRFHANVCAIGMCRPVIGLAALDRVSYLYKSLDKGSYCVDIAEGFSSRVTEIIGAEGFLLSGQCEIHCEKLLSMKKRTADYYRYALRG